MSAENCEYCGSVIFEFERSCNKCGAPRKPTNQTIHDNVEVVGGKGNNLMYTYNHMPTIIGIGVPNGKP